MEVLVCNKYFIRRYVHVNNLSLSNPCYRTIKNLCIVAAVFKRNRKSLLLSNHSKREESHNMALELFKGYLNFNDMLQFL